MTSESPPDSPTDPFGLYRAEWLRDRLFQLYKQPAYFPELETDRPCVLVGGRGTGKTTVLRCLSYDGRFELESSDSTRISSWPYVGFYYRVNTNRVTAFTGSDVPLEKWRRVFGHYVNLLLCGQVTEFLAWWNELAPDSAALPTEACAAVAETLGIEPAHNIADLHKSIQSGRRRFETYLNDLDDAHLPRLSLQGQPIDELCESVRKVPGFRDKALFFIIDEFENLLDYQQEVFNTLIKHSGTHYTFKIGVRELGWRRRSTLNPSEQLVSPADYELIDIGRKLDGTNFDKFALEVCQLRAASIGENSLPVDELLPSMSLEQEALLLGINERVETILESLTNTDVYATLNSMSPLEAYFVDWWSQSTKTSINAILAERKSKAKQWKERFNNYKAAVLFTIKRGKAGIRKYYSGWPTYVKLADGNIRYLLELVSQARLLHQQDGKSLAIPISPETQTRAAQNVGRKNLTELEGLSVDGAQLTKLLLGLGRVFEVMANQPEGHAPEVTQFHLPDDSRLDETVSKLLTAAVMHLALVRTVSNKRMDLDLKSYDYAVHPIFAPFFGFSHRKKRKMALSAAQVRQLVERPRAAIREILDQNNRTADAPLPEQLQLFEGYYGGVAE